MNAAAPDTLYGLPNTSRYYTPSILQLAGVANQTALLLALAPAATNALGTVVGECVSAALRACLTAPVLAMWRACRSEGAAQQPLRRPLPVQLRPVPLL